MVSKPRLLGCNSFGIMIQPANEVIVLAVVSGASRADAGICQDMIVCQKLAPKYAVRAGHSYCIPSIMA